MSKRWRIIALMAFGVFLAAVRVYGGGADDIDSPNFSGNYLVDRTGSHRATISATGRLSVDSTVSHVSSALHVAGQGASGAVKTEEHATGTLKVSRLTCGTASVMLVHTSAARRDLMVNNIGERPVWVGYGATGHVALTIDNGFPLHSMSISSANPIVGENHRYAVLTLANYQGPLYCIGVVATPISIIEILRY